MRLKKSPVDSEVGSKIFRMMPYGIYVVTTRDERGPHGMTASWVMQVSLKPPMLAVAVDRRHTTYEMIRKTMVFAVNLLPKDRADIAERFFTPHQRLGHAPPFADYSFGTTGSPGTAGSQVDTVPTRRPSMSTQGPPFTPGFTAAEV